MKAELLRTTIVRTRAPNKPRTVNCAVCLTPFETQHSQGKYCSPACSREGERKSWRAYGKRNKNRRRKYHGKYYAENCEHISKRIAAYRKTSAGRRAAKISDERQRAKYPEKYQARQEVLKALRKGTLKKQPCSCGNKKVQAHHSNYSKPLEVTWLCDDCHRDEHRKQKAA